VSFNLVLVPGVEANVGVGGVHAQLGGVFDVVGLGPVVGLGGGQQQSDGEQCNSEMAHGLSLRNLETDEYPR
jgi:hypothetical protein